MPRLSQYFDFLTQMNVFVLYKISHLCLIVMKSLMSQSPMSLIAVIQDIQFIGVFQQVGQKVKLN